MFGKKLKIEVYINGDVFEEDGLVSDLIGWILI